MGRQAEGQRRAWGSLGLAAAILNSCFLLTQAQEIPITMEPLKAVKGWNITLTPGGNPDIAVCTWYRGQKDEPNQILTYVPGTPTQENGRSFTGRETGGPNCSLNIRTLMSSDTGSYTVSKTLNQGSEVGRIHIKVLDPFPVSQRHGADHHDSDKGVITGIAAWALAGAVLLRVLL